MPPQTVYVQAPPEPKNGLALTALIMGIVGLLFCLVPITGMAVGGPLSIVAIILGGVGISRANKGRATNKKTAVWGLVLGLLCFVAATADAVIVVTALNHVSNCLDATSNALNHLNDPGAQNAQDQACK